MISRRYDVQVDTAASGEASVDEAGLERLLLPTGARPDQLDVALSWHLHSVLSAIEALPADAATYQVQIARRHLATASFTLARPAGQSKWQVVRNQTS